MADSSLVKLRNFAYMPLYKSHYKSGPLEISGDFSKELRLELAGFQDQATDRGKLLREKENRLPNLLTPRGIKKSRLRIETGILLASISG